MHHPCKCCEHGDGPSHRHLWDQNDARVPAALTARMRTPRAARASDERHAAPANRPARVPPLPVIVAPRASRQSVVLVPSFCAPAPCLISSRRPRRPGRARAAGSTKRRCRGVHRRTRRPPTRATQSPVAIARAAARSARRYPGWIRSRACAHLRSAVLQISTRSSGLDCRTHPSAVPCRRTSVASERTG